MVRRIRAVGAKRWITAAAVVIGILAISSVAFATDGTDSFTMANSFWALVPAIVAIAMALITKEVYSSLFIGIVVGALFVANFNIETTITTIIGNSEDGIGLIGSLSDGGSVGILIFLVELGIIVALINKAGGSHAYGEYAKKSIKTREGAIMSSFGLGCLIFVDDYFNCLTVGSVMRPVTDTHNISRAKLAYIIDATAAPICMIAPISSWAAAVSGLVEGTNGIELFCQAIPYNFYSLLTIAFIILITLMKLDFGPMRKHEKNAKNGDLYTTPERPYENAEEKSFNKNARTCDLVIPIVMLIICCIIGMLYTGGLFSGENFIDAFANCDAYTGLAMGALIALILILIYFRIRRTLNFTEEMNCITKGFIAMVPPILILTFAWTLCGMTGALGAATFVAGAVEGASAGLMNMLPAIIFLVAVGLSFATGTSWATFGILIPIVVAIFAASGDSELMIIGISACLAGSVCGDHCSPISDTTVMASTGAQCHHINHVSTQLPYALTVAAVSFVGFIIAGFVQNVFIALPVAIGMMFGTILIIKVAMKKKYGAEA